MKKPVEFLLVVVLILTGVASLLYIGKNWHTVFPAKVATTEPPDKRTSEQKRLSNKRMQGFKQRADKLNTEINAETDRMFGETTVVTRSPQ